jgi:hypothetical protein
MSVRKSLFLVLAISVLAGGSSFAGEVRRRAVDEVRLAPDGGDPMPFPRPSRGPAVQAGVLAIDGGDPLPRPPHPLA